MKQPQAGSIFSFLPGKPESSLCSGCSHYCGSSVCRCRPFPSDAFLHACLNASWTVLIPCSPPRHPSPPIFSWSVLSTETGTVSLWSPLPPGAAPSWCQCGSSGNSQPSPLQQLQAPSGSLIGQHVVGPAFSLCPYLCKVTVPQCSSEVKSLNSFAALLFLIKPCLTFPFRQMFTLGTAQCDQSSAAVHWELPSTDQFE